MTRMLVTLALLVGACADPTTPVLCEPWTDEAPWSFATCGDGSIPECEGPDGDVFAWCLLGRPYCVNRAQQVDVHDPPVCF